MNKIGKVLVGVGILFLFSSFFFIMHNYYEDINAGNNSQKIVEKVIDIIENKDIDVKEKDDKVLVYQDNNKYNVSGVISIPKLKLELPILSEWDYNRLNVGPCIYYGSLESKDLVICGHSYKRHLKYIYKLVIGDYIVITDVNNQKHIYEVYDKDVIDPYNIDAILNTDYDLTLFSCYNGGTERVVLYCRKVNSVI